MVRGRALVIAMFASACSFSGQGSDVDATPRDADEVVLADGRRVDAMMPSDGPRMVDASLRCEDNANACSSAGGTCVDGGCRIDADGPAKVTCPAGMPCQVICNTNDACKLGVDCGGATSCAVACTANNACQDRGVDCGAATTCAVVCSSNNACQHGPDAGGQSVECRDAGSCDVTCENGNGSTCQDGVDGAMAGACTAHCCPGVGCDGGDTPGCTADLTCP